MGKSESDKLAETVAEARDLVVTLRGIQKDLKTQVREVRELLDKRVEDLIVDATNNKMREVYDIFDRRVVGSAANLQKSLENCFDALHTQAFGADRKSVDFDRFVHMISHVIQECDQHGVLGVTPQEAVNFGNNILVGPPGVSLPDYEDPSGYLVQIGGDGPPDLVIDLRKPTTSTTPTAQQYRNLGTILIKHGFHKHGANIRKNAVTLEEVARTAARTFSAEELDRALDLARIDKNAAAELVRIFEAIDMVTE